MHTHMHTALNKENVITATDRHIVSLGR